MTVFDPDPLVNDVSYEGERVRAITAAMGLPDGHPVHRVRLFRGLKSVGPNGRRLTIVFNHSNFNATSLPTQVTPSQAEWHSLLENWSDLAIFTLPPCRAGTELAPSPYYPHVGDSLTPWDPAQGDYGPAYPKGNGFIVAPGVVPPFYGDVGVPFEDAERFNCAQAACMAVQWAWSVAPSLGVDRAYIDAHSRSSGAWCVAWIKLGPNRAPQTFPAGSGQDAVDTSQVIRRVILRSFVAHWKACKQTQAGTDFAAGFFPALESAPGGPNEMYDQPAIDLNATEYAWQDAMSILYLCQQSEVLAANQAARLWLGFGDSDGWGSPWDLTHVGSDTTGITLIHSSWSMIALELALPDAIRSVLTTTGATSGAYDFLLITLASQLANQLEFLSLAETDGEELALETSALQAPYKSSSLLLEMTLDLGDSGVEIHRLTDADVDVWHGGVRYEALPELEIRVAENTGSLTDAASTILLPLSDLTAAMASGVPQPNIRVLVKEVLEIPGLAGSRVVTTQLAGTVTRARKNPGGRRGFVELSVVTFKGLLGRPSGISCNPECGNIFGDAFTCGVDVEALKQTGRVESITATELTISGLIVPSGFARYYLRGYVERDGVRLSIREWDPGDPETFLTVRAPPAEWLGQEVVVAPGCVHTIDACREYQNEPRFLGLGFGIPAYFPITDKPE